MMKHRARPRRGWTIIELLIVMAIISILASIIMPKYDVILQKAHQATTRGNLGSIRSTIGLYYSDQTGIYPMQGYANGYPYDNGESLTGILCPKYIERLPVPQLFERAGNFNGTGEIYDQAAIANLDSNPPRDIYIYRGNADANPLTDTPWAYDPASGLIYINNDNFDWQGQAFYTW